MGRKRSGAGVRERGYYIFKVIIPFFSQIPTLSLDYLIFTLHLDSPSAIHSTRKNKKTTNPILQSHLWIPRPGQGAYTNACCACHLQPSEIGAKLQSPYVFLVYGTYYYKRKLPISLSKEDLGSIYPTDSRVESK